MQFLSDWWIFCCMAGGNGGTGGYSAPPPQGFCRSVSPNPTGGGAAYFHHITTCPPDIQTFCRLCVLVPFTSLVKVVFFQKVMAKIFNLSKCHSCEPKFVLELLIPFRFISKILVIFEFISQKNTRLLWIIIKNLKWKN